MGVENNECVIATTWDNKAMNVIKKRVAALNERERSLFAFVPSLANAKETVFLAPTGSKKGWRNDRLGAAMRDELISWFSEFTHNDDSNPFDWVEVGYGEFGQTILRGNCINQYTDAPYCEWE